MKPSSRLLVNICIRRNASLSPLLIELILEGFDRARTFHDFLRSGDVKLDEGMKVRKPTNDGNFPSLRSRRLSKFPSCRETVEHLGETTRYVRSAVARQTNFLVRIFQNWIRANPGWVRDALAASSARFTRSRLVQDRRTLASTAATTAGRATASHTSFYSRCSSSSATWCCTTRTT